MLSPNTVRAARRTMRSRATQNAVRFYARVLPTRRCNGLERELALAAAGSPPAYIADAAPGCELPRTRRDFLSKSNSSEVGAAAAPPPSSTPRDSPTRVLLPPAPLLLAASATATGLKGAALTPSGKVQMCCCRWSQTWPGGGTRTR